MPTQHNGVTEYQNFMLGVNDYQGAQEISQEVLIKAYRKLGQLKWPHRFRSWLYTIVSNECKMWLRKHSKEREQEVSWEDVPAEKLDELMENFLP